MSLGNKNWQHLIGGGGGGQQLVVGNKCDTLGGISRDRQDSSCFVYPLSLALFVSFFACMQVVGTYGGHLYTMFYFSSHGHKQDKQDTHTFESEGCIVMGCGDL